MRATYHPLPTPDYLRREVERVAASVAARGSAAAHIDRRPELEPSSWRRLVARLRIA